MKDRLDSVQARIITNAGSINIVIITASTSSSHARAPYYLALVPYDIFQNHDIEILVELST